MPKGRKRDRRLRWAIPERSLETVIGCRCPPARGMHANEPEPGKPAFTCGALISAPGGRAAAACGKYMGDQDGSTAAGSHVLPANGTGSSVGPNRFDEVV